MRVLAQPLVEPSKLLPKPTPNENPLLSGVRSFTQTAEGVTSPIALATIVGTAGVGALGTVGASIARGATGLFGLGAAVGAGEAGVSGYQKMKAGDMNGAARDWGMGSADGLFAALAARAAFRGTPEVAADMQTAREAWAKAGPETPPAAPDTTGPSGGGSGAPRC